jgi:RNA:NAD 2'-phosphotransferase (TPT1/KptA family)
MSDDVTRASKFLSYVLRRGRPVVLLIDSAAMSTDGHEFVQAANGVWLTRHVPPAFISFAGGPPAPD